MPSPEFQTLLEQLRAQPPPEAPSLDALRAGVGLVTGMVPLSIDVHWEKARAGRVPAEWVTTITSEPGRVILYLHGGGFVTGAPATHRDLVSRICRSSQARALVLEYRLAPEHPFPAALEDIFAAYRWLLERGANPQQVIIAGDSAGAALALGTLVSLRDSKQPLPAAAALLSPWVDLEGPWDERASLDPVLTPQLLRWFADAYLGDMDPEIPLASPIRADLTGLPPLLIQSGTSEILYGNAERLAGRAAAAGVEVTFEPWPDMIHVWHLFAAMIPEGSEAIERVGEFVRRHAG